MATVAKLIPSSSLKSPAKVGLWLKRFGIGLLITLITLSATGFTYQTIATEADKRNLPPPGQLFDVGGFRLHINCIGTGSPTVILEALSGGFSSYWAWVQPEVAKQVRVCAYDRAGFGWSERDPQPETPERTANNLHTLLEKANIAGPYVLVGHSKGGLYVREFTALYPQEVVGLVLLDASHPDQFQRHPDWLTGDTAMLKWIPLISGLLRLGVAHAYFALGGEIDFKELPTRQHAEVAATWASPNYWAEQEASMLAATDIFQEAQNLGSLGDLPLVVVSRSQDVANGWSELQDELAALSTNSLHLTIEGSSHSSLVFNPDQARQVSAVIIQVVKAVQNGLPLSAKCYSICLRGAAHE